MFHRPHDHFLAVLQAHATVSICNATADHTDGLRHRSGGSCLNDVVSAGTAVFKGGGDVLIVVVLRSTSFTMPTAASVPPPIVPVMCFPTFLVAPGRHPRNLDYCFSFSAKVAPTSLSTC